MAAGAFPFVVTGILLAATLVVLVRHGGAQTSESCTEVPGNRSSGFHQGSMNPRHNGRAVRLFSSRLNRSPWAASVGCANCIVRMDPERAHYPPACTDSIGVTSFGLIFRHSGRNLFSSAVVMVLSRYPNVPFRLASEAASINPVMAAR